MTLAIKWGQDDSENSGLIYLDAVTVYTQSHEGKVTSHPIANGGLITDFFIRSNPKFNIGAVITGVDISTGTYLIRDLDDNVPFNARPAPDAISVTSTDQSVLQKFLPSSIGQFLSDSSPDVTVDRRRVDLMEQIRQALVDLSSGLVYNDKTNEFDPTVQLVQLYEFDGSVLKKIISNLVITKLNFKEDANSGYALYCDIAFEQVTFAFLKKTVIPKDVVASLQKKAAPKTDKGKQDSTEQETGPKDVDPLRKAQQEANP